MQKVLCRIRLNWLVVPKSLTTFILDMSQASHSSVFPVGDEPVKALLVDPRRTVGFCRASIGGRTPQVKEPLGLSSSSLCFLGAAAEI